MRVDHRASRVRPRDPAHCELRVIGQCGADPDHHHIDQRPQPVQMGEPGRPVDVFRMAGDSGDAAVDRLAELPDDDQIIDQAAAQRLEHRAPGCRKSFAGPPEHPGNGGPASVPRLNAQVIAGARFVSAVFRSVRHRVMIFGDTDRENARIDGEGGKGNNLFDRGVEFFGANATGNE